MREVDPGIVARSSMTPAEGHPTNTFDVDVLAFGPHPDDVELFCGGTMITLADLGYSTGVVDLTRGERGTRGTPEERAREAEAASDVLGLTFRENLGLPDAFLDSGSDDVLRVVEVLRRRRPELVLVPWFEDRHPDHAAAARLVTRAIFLAGLAKIETTPASVRFTPRQVLHYAMRHAMTPSFIVDTTAAAERKARAIACYASQLWDRACEAPSTLIGSPRAVEAIITRDRYFGCLIGCEHGEALRSPSTLALRDPLAYVRTNPSSGAHMFEAIR